ncbi:hypothetical protein [Amycolatopsis sp. NPDC003861]
MQMADGGGGGSFTDILNPLSSAGMGAAVQSVTAETQKLLDAAKGGGFKITPEGVKPIRDALNDLMNDITALGDATYTLSQSPQLGNHPYGHTVASHDQKGAAQADNSAGVVLEKLKAVAMQADEALARAAGLYKESESAAFASLQTKS